MRSVPVFVALALGAVVLASGCGQQHAGTPAGPPLSTSATAAPVPSPVPGDPGAASCGSAAPPIALITITYADNGRTLCVRHGTAVQVYLKGTPTNRWSPIHASNDVLTPHAHGRLLLKLGVTGASFLAAHRGHRHYSLVPAALRAQHDTRERRRAVRHHGVWRNHRLPRHGEGHLTANECGRWHSTCKRASNNKGITPPARRWRAPRPVPCCRGRAGAGRRPCTGYA